MSRLLRATEYAKIIIERFKNLEGIAVDMTLGNGNDSEVLADNFKQVMAFDVQAVAIQATKKRLVSYQNIEYYLDSHANVDLYIKKPVDLFIYNLGYLPNYDTTITTKVSSTIESLQKALTLLKVKGVIIISVYPGHDEGAKEAEALNYFIKELADNYQVAYYKVSNKTAPYVICIYKIR